MLLLSPNPLRVVEVAFNIRAEAAARGIHPDRIRLDDHLSRGEHIEVGAMIYVLELPLDYARRRYAAVVRGSCQFFFVTS